MATHSSSASPSMDESATDCPQCESICLGASILPCGHLVCKTCLHSLVQQGGSKLACKTCGEDLSLPEGRDLSVSRLAQLFGTDPVMEQLVNLRLESQGRRQCSACDCDRDATMVCQDCKKSYCDACCDAHTKMAAYEDHALLLLSHALPDNSDFSQSIADTEGLQSRVKSRNKSRGESCNQQEWKQWVKKQTGQLQQAATNQQTVVSTLKEIVSLAERLLKEAETEEKILKAYAACLPQYDVIELSDVHAFVIILSEPDVTMEVKMETLESRLCDIIKGSQSKSVANFQKIAEELSNLTHDEEAKRSSSPSFKDAQEFADSPNQPTGTPSESAKETPTIPNPIVHQPTADPMTASPKNVFTVALTADDDTQKPFIDAIAYTHDDRLVMADGGNYKVKIVDLQDPKTVTTSVKLDFKPLSLVALHDGLVALTTDNTVIYLLDLVDTVTATQIKTSSQYAGVVGSTFDETLIVSCCKNNTQPARVDVINRAGDVVRTIADITTIPGLEFPGHLCLVDRHVLIADSWKDFVYYVDPESCKLTEVVTHTGLNRPSQIAADKSGNVYVASRDSQRVLVRSREGEWRCLLEGPQHSEQGCFWPWGVCVTTTGRIIVAWRKAYSHSVVIGYDV